MRIVHLIPHLSGGGAEQQLGYLSQDLARKGHDVHVIYTKIGINRPQLKGVTLHKIKTYSNYNPFLLWQVHRLVKLIKPDIIHTWVIQMDILGGLIARLNSVPWVLREPNQSKAYKQSWKTRLRVRVASMANAIVANSQGGEKYWERMLPDSQRYVIPNGLPKDKIEGIEAAFPKGMAEPEEPLILYVGRMIKHKNIVTLLNALSSVQRKEKFFGILCGYGAQQNELELLSRELGLTPYIKFMGHLPAEKIYSLMKKSSVFVSLSEYEGCPNTVMESMACNCPVVLSDIPAHREILDDNSAYFVDATNIKQTAEAIIMALGASQETKKRAEIAKQLSNKWSIEEMATNYETIYKRVLSFN